MKYGLLAFTVFILAALLYKYGLAEDEPVRYTTAVALQRNPFTVPEDSAITVWQRARQYFVQNASLLSGGPLETSDSTLYLPYYNDHHKGNAIRITKHLTTDSVFFQVQWWYSGKLQEKGGKEIALFMQQGLKERDLE